MTDYTPLVFALLAAAISGLMYYLGHFMGTGSGFNKGYHIGRTHMQKEILEAARKRPAYAIVEAEQIITELMK